MSAAALAIEAREIRRQFGRFSALGGVDLEVPAGATVALFGTNGAGKTTFLRILAQVLRPTAGSVRILGRDPGREQEEVLRSLGFLSHETALYLDLTADENVAFTCRLHGLEDPAERARAALDEVSVAATDRPVRALSRGNQQRVALARAMVHRPAVVLLDEPWTGLDRSAQRVLADRLAAHRAAGGTTVLTTHDLRAGYDAADWVALLASGRVTLHVSRSEISFAELERAFAGPGED